MNIPELEIYQTKIYYGLKTIGEEIASFYLDGVKLIKDPNYTSKSYLIGHIAREIDGGLRDILAPKEFQTNHKFEDVPQNIRNHVNSILLALDSDRNTPLIKEYIDVATTFVKFAHRSGAYREPRDAQEIINLWNRYEKILLKLFGDYINQLKHIDRILKFQKPTEYILETLPNFFTDESKKNHFYEKLKNQNWFIPMYEKGFFNANTIEKDKHWTPLTYLMYVSEEIKQKNFSPENSKHLINIIYNLTDSNNYNEYSNDIRLWYYLFKILSSLPKSYIKNDFINILPKFFNSQDSTLTGKGAIEFVESYFLEDEISEDGKHIIEEILMYSFDLTNDKNYRDISRNKEESIFPKVELYILKDISKSINFCKKISSICSNSLLFYIADRLEIYLNSEYNEGIFKNSIFFDEKRTSSEDSIDVVYTDFLKKTIFNISLNYTKRHREIAETILSTRYKHYYIRRLFFYIVSLNWNNTKELFWTLINNNDENKCFSNWENNEDLYFLLEKISKLLNIEECKYLEKIIDFGSQEESFYFERLDDFRLYWFSALKDSQYFNSEFEDLSLKKGRSYNSLKPKRQTFVTWGSISPFNKKELLNLTSLKLAENVKNFDPLRGFKKPDVDGLANVLEELFSENPDLFTDNYENYLDAQFFYCSRILNGLSKSIETNKPVNLKNILLFIDRYINQDSFKINKLKLLNDNTSYDNFSFIRASCRLLEKVISSKNLKDEFSIIDNIFKQYILYVNPKSESFKTQTELGSLMHLYNSDNGIIIKSYFYFILKKVNRLKGKSTTKKPKWDIYEKILFEKLSDENCIDFFMLLSHLKSNFLYVDYHWTMEKIKSIPYKNDEIIKAFFGVQILSGDPTGEDYKIFKDTYKRAIDENWIFDKMGGSYTLERHIGVFYLFGYDNFEKDSIIETFFNSKRIDNIGSLIHFYSFYVYPHLKTLSIEEQKKIKSRIILLWDKCYKVLIKFKTEDSKAEISGLINFLQYIDEINEANFHLIYNTSLIAVRHWEMDTLLTHLNRLKEKVHSEKSASYIIQLLNSTIFIDLYYFRNDKDDLFQIMEYLYQLEIKPIKDELNKLCNDLAKKGLHFSDALYERYNSLN
jgi:hypothetical protein